MLVAGEREPRGEVCWIEPRVAENTSVPSFDKQACLAEECNLQIELLICLLRRLRRLPFAIPLKKRSVDGNWFLSRYIKYIDVVFSEMKSQVLTLVHD